MLPLQLQLFRGYLKGKVVLPSRGFATLHDLVPVYLSMSFLMST